MSDTRPFAPYEWMLARRYLGSKRKETAVSVISAVSFLGIMLGVMLLIVVMSVMGGFRAELRDRLLGINGHVIVQPDQMDLVDYDAVTRRIEALPEVDHAFPLIEGKALGTGGEGGTGILVRGLRDADLLRIDQIADNVRDGTLESFSESGGVAIGSRLAASLGLVVGDDFTIVAPEGNVTAFGTTPRVKAYPVAAIFEMGMSEYDGLFVFMPFEEAQLFFNRDGQAQAIEIYLDDADAVDPALPRIREAAQRPVTLEDWRQRNATFFRALEVERNMMFIIVSIVVVVAALNIISGLLMLVKDKSRDIAILRTMGIGKGSVLRIFFMTGAAIGVFGTIAGTILGLVIATNIKPLQDALDWLTGTQVWDPTVRFLTDTPAKIDAVEILSIIAMALTLSFLATFVPAWRAAKLDPVEALRYE